MIGKLLETGPCRLAIVSILLLMSQAAFGVACDQHHDDFAVGNDGRWSFYSADWHIGGGVLSASDSVVGQLGVAASPVRVNLPFSADVSLSGDFLDSDEGAAAVYLYTSADDLIEIEGVQTNAFGAFYFPGSGRARLTYLDNERRVWVNSDTWVSIGRTGLRLGIGVDNDTLTLLLDGEPTNVRLSADFSSVGSLVTHLHLGAQTASAAVVFDDLCVSSSASGATQLAAPTGLDHSIQGNSLRISWQAVVGSSGYRMYYGLKKSTDDPFDATAIMGSLDLGTSAQFGPYDVRLLAPGNYFVVVAAYDAQGRESPYSAEHLVPVAASGLSAPGNLRHRFDKQKLTISWDAVAGAKGYRMHYGVKQRSGDAFDSERILGFVDLGGNTSFGPYDSSVLARDVYFVAVSAYDATGGESTYSEEHLVAVGARGELRTGDSVPLLSGGVGKTGGVLRVQGSGTVLDGMTLDIPPDAYPQQVAFQVSSRTISGSGFGDWFAPLTPLIHIDNGGVFSNRPVRVTVPLQLSPSELPVAFYYLEDTGTLEIVPIVAIGSQSVTLSTRHFSEIVITSAERDDIQAIIAGERVLSSGYKPEVDDWQFDNDGSYIEPGGHCLGQVLTSMWYYATQKSASGPSLHGLLDNNSGPKTPGYWQDDSYGYKFASVIQKAADPYYKQNPGDFIDRAGSLSEDEANFLYFVFSLYFLKEPQLAVITSSSSDSGHALLVYEIEGGKLRVSDPNHSGGGAPPIVFDLNAGAFQPYVTGTRVGESPESFDTIRLTGKRAVVPWETIAAEWQKVKDGSVGNGYFPNCEILYKGKTLTDRIAYQEDKPTFQARCVDAGSGDQVDVGLHAVINLDGSVYGLATSSGTSNQIEVDLANYREADAIELGFYLYANPEGQASFVDFQWFSAEFGEDGGLANPGITDAWYGLRIHYQFSGVTAVGSTNDFTMNDVIGRKLVGQVQPGASQVCVTGSYQINAPKNAISRYDLTPGDGSRTNQYISRAIDGSYPAVYQQVAFSYCQPVQTGGVGFRITGDVYPDLFTRSVWLIADFVTQ